MSEPSKQWRAIFAGTVPKDFTYPESNEDKLDVCDARRVYVMSDGASESYNSKLWAEVLVKQAGSGALRPPFTRWLKHAIAQYDERSDLANLSWSQEAAFARGSFASLLVVILHDDRIQVIGIGDTIVVLVVNNRIEHSFPYEDFEQFRQRPHLLSTVRSRHSTQFFRDALRSLIDRSCSQSGCSACWSYPLSSDAILICATDAIGEWLLRKDDQADDRLRRIVSVRTQEDLTELVEKARFEDRMRRDDSSLILIGEANGTSHA
jgi:hypothetical protein